jgi:enoyl-CoA hydratase
LSSPRVVDAGGVRTITLDRPEVRNALTLGDLDVVTAAVRDLPQTVRAIVLTGAGDLAFSSGMHVQTFVDTPPEQGRELIRRVGACTGAVRLAPVPTIAVVRGYCLGAAFEIALACDLRVATPDARFGLPEVLLGIPSVVDAALLRHHVGLSRAKELVLTGAHYSVDELPGLVNRVAEADRIDAVLGELLSVLTSLTPDVMAAQKVLFETWLNVGLQEGIEASIDVFGDVFALPVTQQVVAGYRVRGKGARRPPA